jgi:hypothetical protein
MQKSKYQIIGKGIYFNKKKKNYAGSEHHSPHEVKGK